MPESKGFHLDLEGAGLNGQSNVNEESRILDYSLVEADIDF